MSGASDVTVRVAHRHERDAVRAVAVSAFGGDERIGALVDALAASWAWEDELCFVAERDGVLVGQVLFTHAILDAPDELVDVLVLSPVGVVPELHGQGVGSELITRALEVVERRTEPLVFLEGHPAFYPRFGFRPARPLGFLAPSVRIPGDAFMVRPQPGGPAGLTGQLVYPDAFWRVDAVGVRDAAGRDGGAHYGAT